MSGFIHDPLQIVNLITDNLRDRYKSGLPVLKEIIQNADDAGSANEPIQLEFGLSQGIADAKHPLLKGPALYFLNNGSFEDSDEKAIRSFGLNRKASDQYSIGKFGLGMKSVFHFCEAFFFIAKNKHKHYRRILNPWSGGEDYESFHDDWNEFEESDVVLIRKHVWHVLQKMDIEKDASFFLLWLPLRQKKHLLVNGNEVGSIISEFPGDDRNHLDFLHEPGLTQKIALLLPLLRRINRISFWAANYAKEYFQVSIKGARLIGITDTQFQDNALDGGVSCIHNGEHKSSFSLKYAGREQICEIPELLALRQSSLWPKSYVRNDRGMSCEAPDKAQGHSAVVFSKTNERSEGRLIIQWAVFLPVETAKEEVSCGGDSAYSLTLHGYFFIDAGRIGIEGLLDAADMRTSSAPRSEVELRKLWNTQLAKRGTLPLVIPALEAFVINANLSSADIRNLSAGIENSDLFSRHRKSICSVSSWVCCLTPQGQEWRVILNKQEVLPMPAPPASAPQRPWKTFPNLEKFQNNGAILLLDCDAPNLIATHSLPQWKISSILELLPLCGNEVFSDQGCLEYFLVFMKYIVKPFCKIESVQSVLIHIFNNAFIQYGVELYKNIENMQELVSYILQENRYFLPDAPHVVIDELQQCKLDVLILPKELAPNDNPENAKLNIENTFTLLNKLHDLILRYEHQDDQILNRCRVIAGELLKGLDEGQRRALLIMAERLKILDGYDCLLKKQTSLSPTDLKDCHESRLLFRYSQGFNEARLGLAPKLQQAINERVILVTTDTANLVFADNNDLAPCHANSAFDSLGTKCMPLRGIETRKQLLTEAVGADLNSEARARAMRYLLHGFEQRFGDEATLWVSGYNQSPVWEKLWQQLTSLQEDAWSLLERKLVEEIPTAKWQKLSILEIKPDGILTELRKIGTVGIAGEQFSHDEREVVMAELVSDQELWKKLPFHETVGGELVCIIPGKAFLETEICLPEPLRNSVDIIKRSKNPLIEQQQERWLTPLSKDAVIRIALQHEKPENFWRLIMDNLDGANGLLTDPLLRDTPWLVDHDCASVRPSDVVWLDTLQDDVDRLLVYARGAFWSPGKLLADLQLHSLFKLLMASSFATGSEGFEKLALLLGEVPEYHVGSIVYQSDDFDRIVRICARLPVYLGLPGWGLLSSAINTAPEMTAKYLLAEILKPIDPERIISILGCLSKEHSTSKNDKKDILIAFNAYLTAFAKAGCGASAISKLFLQNREGDWTPAHELCSEAEGVANSHLLDDEQKRILNHIIFHADRQQAIEDDKTPRKGDLQSEISASADQLEILFAEWEGLVAPELICAFISLLGDDPNMLALAKRYQGSHSLEWIRDNIPWKIHHRTDELNRGEWMYGLSQHQALAQHRFIIRCTEGDMVQTRSILGEEVTVPLQSRFSSLITGGLFYEYPSGQINRVRLSLRQPQVEDASSAALSGYLKASAEYLLKKAYEQNDCDLTQLWNELDCSEQLDISIAQQLVLDHIPFYLRQLKVHNHPKLQNLHDEWDEARFKREEYRGTKEKKDKYDAQVRSILEKIQYLLKHDDDVQHAVLKAVRRKIEDFQYIPASIPFELFQNADDAVLELATVKAYPDPPEEIGNEILPEHVRRFIVLEQESSLFVIHWGRPINSIGSVGFPGREKGFHRDLEKMLILSSSDKSEESNVTGKYGLGFKSVLLACERPKLLSGRLATEIIAGLSPVPLKESAQLRSKLSDLSPDKKWQGTLLELPLTDVTSDVIMKEFERLSGIMTIFSKQIQRIDIHRNISSTWEWKPEVLQLSNEACLEISQLPFPEVQQHKFIAAYFRLHDGGILFAMGPCGFRKLPNELPAIWVVAPTKESEGLGIAVNCMFALDAGRSRLAGNSSVNKCKAINLGTAFGKSLQKLYEVSLTRWDALKEKFRLEGDLSKYDFWESIWRLIGEAVKSRGSTEINILVSHLFCGESGLGYLISNEDAMPNGLWDSYQVLTRPEKIRIVLQGILGSESIFREIVKWEYFRNFVGAPLEVTTESVYTIARSIFPQIGQVTNQWKSVSLENLLRNLGETEKNIAPSIANLLGSLFSNNVFKHEGYEKEKDLLDKVLHAFFFKSKDGCYHSAREIIVPYKHNRANPDEVKRAAFSPQKYVLSNEYQGSGLDFFFVCRDKITIPVEEMAQWLVTAQTDSHKAEGLRYLLEGEHGDKVAKILRERGLEGTWLVTLQPESDVFRGWEKQDVQEILLRMLPSIDELVRLHVEAGEIPDDLPGEWCSWYEPQDILRKIHSWWMDTKDGQLADYELRTYPDGIPFNLAEDDAGRIDRASWLILFSLAHFQTIGRQKDIQHKGFIEKCLSKGWWDIFSKANPEKYSDEWMNVLEEYIQEQVDSSEYEFWMNRFPAIYKFSRGLEDYKETFLSIERMQNLSSISGILNSRVNANFQGGGFSAPPIEKSLGVGAYFTLRELKRKRIINRSHVVPFCYVPLKRTREFCENIGCIGLSDNRGDHDYKSQMIHRFLCNFLGEQHAEFSNSYDIPLQILAENREVLSSILN